MTIDYLTYHIEFPSATPKKSTLNGENNNFLFSGKLHVVVLFGWAGCQDKHLARYSAIYEELGFITLRCTAPFAVFSYRLEKLQGIGEKFLDFLRGKSLDEHPIIFHNFSISGTLLYQSVSVEMQKRNKILQIKGVIFDSSPNTWSFYNVYRGIGVFIGGPTFYKVPASVLAATVLIGLHLFKRYANAVWEFKKPETKIIDLDDEPHNWPQLFIYSKKDELIAWEEIENFARYREEKGIKVTKLRLENSPHLQHFIMHRDIYVNTIVNFIQDCLNEDYTMKCRL